MLNNSLAEQVIIDILTQEMGLAAEQIWIRDQNRKIPETPGLFVIVGLVDGRPIGIDNTVVPTEDGMKEIQQTVALENIMIDLVSKNNEATLRRWEVVLALRSIYSIQMQEKNWFKVFRIPRSFVNASSAEGGSQINRFSVTVPCHVWYRKEKVLSSPNGDYYDDFDTRVDDAKTIGTEHGIIEFNITDED